jgi:hypothetical protein
MDIPLHSARSTPPNGLDRPVKRMRWRRDDGRSPRAWAQPGARSPLATLGLGEARSVRRNEVYGDPRKLGQSRSCMEALSTLNGTGE